MTTPAQLATDAGDLLAVMTCLAGVLAIAGAIIARRRRRRLARPLPMPDDPRQRNDTLVKDWKRRRDLRERYIDS